MADISRLSRLSAGIQRGIDLSGDALVVGSLKVGSSSPTELTKTILDRLVSLQNGTDVDATCHTHDGRYFTKTELGSSTSGSAGSKLIGDDNSYTNFSPASATVKAALTAIDSALGSVVVNEFADDVFRIKNVTDPTKKIAFDASAITTSTVRTITMPDADVDLGALANITLSNLGTTAINTDLIPDATANNRTIGNDTSMFYKIFTYDIKGPGTSVFNEINVNGGFLRKYTDAAGNQDTLNWSTGVLSYYNSDVGYETMIPSVDWASRWLVNKKNVTLVDWSGDNIDFKAKVLTNAADPVSDQDVATKKYVDDSVSGSTLTADGEGVEIVSQVIQLELDGTTLSKSASGLKVNEIANAQIASAAAIDLTKLAALTNHSRALVSDASGFIAESAVTSTELGYLSGVTSSVQTQLNNLSSLIQNFEWQESVISAQTLDPTSLTPSAGDRYLINGTGAGDWTGKDNQIAEWSGSAWVYTVCTTGTFVSADDQSDRLYQFGGASWSAKYFEATTASTGLTKVGFDVRLADATGTGISVASGALSVLYDNSTIGLSSNNLYVKNAGISATQLATGAFDQNTITGGAGTAAAVQSAPVVKVAKVAGEALSASTLYAVRYAKAADSGYVAGRMYKADIDASSVDNFYVAGLVYPASAISAGDAIVMFKKGMINVPSHGFTIGSPVFLDASGAVTETPSSTASMAVVRVGLVADANNIDVDIQVIGVN